jgi:hypothetical protein
MKKTEIYRKPVRNKQKEEELLRKLNLDESGFVIYPGTGTIQQRTGSPAMALINWHLYREGREKPLDYDIFKDLID